MKKESVKVKEEPEDEDEKPSTGKGKSKEKMATMAKSWYSDVTGWKAATVAAAVISEADASGAMVIIKKVKGKAASNWC